MASINKAIIVGNLGRDPETKNAGADGAVLMASLTVATTRRYKPQGGQVVSETEWHRVTLFARLAEVARDYLHKGSLVYIEGRIRTRKFAGKDGQERYVTEIIGETLQLLDRRGDAEGESARPATMSREQQAEAYKAEQRAFEASGGEDVPF